MNDREPPKWKQIAVKYDGGAGPEPSIRYMDTDPVTGDSLWMELKPDGERRIVARAPTPMSLPEPKKSEPQPALEFSGSSSEPSGKGSATFIVRPNKPPTEEDKKRVREDAVWSLCLWMSKLARNPPPGVYCSPLINPKEWE